MDLRYWKQTKFMVPSTSLSPFQIKAGLRSRVRRIINTRTDSLVLDDPDESTWNCESKEDFLLGKKKNNHTRYQSNANYNSTAYRIARQVEVLWCKALSLKRGKSLRRSVTSHSPNSIEYIINHTLLQHKSAKITNEITKEINMH